MLAVEVLHFVFFFFPECHHVFNSQSRHEQFCIVHEGIVFDECCEFGLDVFEEPDFVFLCVEAMFFSKLPEPVPEVNAYLKTKAIRLLGERSRRRH